MLAARRGGSGRAGLSGLRVLRADAGGSLAAVTAASTSTAASTTIALTVTAHAAAGTVTPGRLCLSLTFLSL